MKKKKKRRREEESGPNGPVLSGLDRAGHSGHLNSLSVSLSIICQRQYCTLKKQEWRLVASSSSRRLHRHRFPAKLTWGERSSVGIASCLPLSASLTLHSSRICPLFLWRVAVAMCWLASLLLLHLPRRLRPRIPVPLPSAARARSSMSVVRSSSSSSSFFVEFSR